MPKGERKGDGEWKVVKTTDGAGTETTKASYCKDLPSGGKICGEYYKISGDGNNAGTGGGNTGRGVGVGVSFPI